MRSKIFLIAGGAMISFVSAGVTLFILTQVIHKVSVATTATLSTSKASNQAKTETTTVTTTPSTTYGDTYANGILPVGDNKYSTTAPQKGNIYLCQAPGANGPGGGASTRGPWFTNNNTEYDLNKKISVSGKVSWTGNYTMKIVNGQRIITTNDLPLSHATGTFPISTSDPAHAYDGNPNSIKTQTLSFTLPASPTALSAPGCMGGGTIGIMTTGVALFNGFDAEGRDAGAWEIQDSCGGHPQISGEYHYHTLSSCITDVSSTTVIGYAIDGYPITGPTVNKGNIMTTKDLDECHGTTSSIMLDGSLVNTYHYVMTQDFPYSISCFKAATASTHLGPQ
jgi:hypothetical protein